MPDLARSPGARGPLDSVVGPLDAEGRGQILVVVDGRGGPVFASFTCDVREGIVASNLEPSLSRDEADARLREAADRLGLEAARGCPVSARLLLAGSSWLSGTALGEETTARLRETMGEAFRPHPVFADPAAVPDREEGESDSFADARAILARRKSWRDDSPLARDLAIERRLHDGGSPPDPARDPGPFRVLFEGRILGRIELYRRMLLWSAMVWHESGDSAFSRAAMRIAGALGDPQNAIPELSVPRGADDPQPVGDRSRVGSDDEDEIGESGRADGSRTPDARGYFFGALAAPAAGLAAFLLSAIFFFLFLSLGALSPTGSLLRNETRGTGPSGPATNLPASTPGGKPGQAKNRRSTDRSRTQIGSWQDRPGLRHSQPPTNWSSGPNDFMVCRHQ